MNSNIVLFKDKEDFRRYSDTYYKWYKKFAYLLKNCNSIDDYKELFWDEKIVQGPETHPNHIECGFDIKNDKSKIDEPRMCRCMFYFDEDNSKCQQCPIKSKFKNVSKFIIKDHEIPMHHVYQNCGGIDLVITDENNVDYYVEMKDGTSKETIVRMVSEIYTYTLDDEERFSHKAIGFFEKSAQFREYLTEKGNPDFDYILKDISVFVFKNINVDEHGVISYDIEKEQ